MSLVKYNMSVPEYLLHVLMYSLVPCVLPTRTWDININLTAFINS